MSGKLIGVGVGPGDPDLMTVKGLDALAAAKVVTHVHATGRPPIALKIAQDGLPDDVIEVAISVPMGADDATRQAAYDKAIPELRQHLDADLDVTFVCEGDALFYGSFQYVMDRLSGNYEVEIIPGVSSINASAAAAKLCFARGNETVQVLPATLPDGALAARLSDTNCTFAIIKLGRHLGRVKAVLARLGRLDGAVLVEKATWAEERILALKDYDGESAYFAQIIVGARRSPDAFALPKDVALVCLNAAALKTAQSVRAQLPNAQLWGLSGRVDKNDVDQVFTDVTATLQDLFTKGTPIAAFAASGLIVRALAPVLADKRVEPAVVAVAPDGSFAVPLVGGHGGANRLATAISKITKGFAAITTAGDSALGLALDEPPQGWSVQNPEAAKAVVANRLSGQSVGLQVDSGDATWLSGFAEGDDVRVTHMNVTKPDGSLILHAPTLSLGVGCERDCDPADLKKLVDKTLFEANISPQSIACVCSIDVKSDEAAVLDLAKTLGVPARFFTAEQLSAEEPRLKNPSEVVKAEVGCLGVSEGAALAAVGASGSLLVEKQKSKRATCAVGLSPTDINPDKVGKGRGRLFVLGIGPGVDGWRTPEVTRILSSVTDVVGYGFYLDLIVDLIQGKHHHTSNLAQEEERVRHALDLAAQGKDVALISSGDVGIYAMAALAFELLDREDRADWNRLYIQVEPGISAFQAAAARIGAPVGHDFCLISLSDLLTPWEVIERRLKAAAVGGFVVSFYNPVSKRRRTQLAQARDILLQHRDPQTPVILARQLGRPEEDIRVITLAELTPDMADMLTLVMVGGEDTRKIERGQKTWVYTPRGYGKKMDAKPQGEIK
ncbi:MAG: precorrin-3B C(17)-methyltransferase [Magnetovibrio sp.]|nr:precorrin-3B C(17)-methyltransferase [Magnetovibrio sp.]